MARLIVLNGVPRSGKSSIAAEVLRLGGGPWVNLGVDSLRGQLPERLQPGIGLRPNAGRQDLEPYVRTLFLGLYASAIGWLDAGVSVCMDVGHHDAFRRPLGTLPACARLVGDRNALLVGVRCGLDEIGARREATAMAVAEERLWDWESAIHSPGVYDLEVFTDRCTPEEAARAILSFQGAPEAFLRLARMDDVT